MSKRLNDWFCFLYRCVMSGFHGTGLYYAWVTFLIALSLIGLNAYCKQLVHGLYLTGMNDHVSWGLYIANFTYLVGMAAAAVMVVIPVYVYKKDQLRDVVILGELFAITSIIMCLLFVIVDLGRPDRFWHLIPGLGKFNWPYSMLSWDVVVLNIYLFLNMYIAGYLLYTRYLGRQPKDHLYKPYIFLSIGWAISIHMVTAFLFAGLAGKAFWNSAVLGPRFIASAFASGPAFIILTLQIIHRFSHYQVSTKALLSLRKIIQVAMIINIFLLGNELFAEFYAESLHVASIRYLFFGLHGHNMLVPWIWTAVAFNMISLGLLMHPISIDLRYLNIACILCVIGIWIEKGMGLLIPGFIPTPMGEIVEYVPTLNEILICVGIWAFGFLIYTVLAKISIPILLGNFHISSENSQPFDESCQE